MFTYRTALIICSCFLSINAYIKLDLKNPTTKYGFVYPNRAEPNSNVTYVLEGVDVLIYIAKIPEDYAACEITSPDVQITYSLSGKDDSSRVEFWSPDPRRTECGARIKNVTVSDSGRWRLQAINAENDHRYQSFINLKVIKNFDRPDGDFIIREGPFDEFNMTQYASYCEISDPVLLGEYKIFDKCQVDLENINKLYAGKWKANVGVLGKVDEIILQPKVEVLGEYFDVGTNETKINNQPTKINLFCNLKNAVDTNVTFCRFIKDGSKYGLRLSEGLSNGNYSYFGRKLKDGDCGVTIENPQIEDYGLWKCSLGVHRLVNKTTITYEVKESVISVMKGKKRSIRAAENEIVTLNEVLAGLRNTLVLSHKTDYQIKYCIVEHPNGTQYAINGYFRNDNWTTFGDINIGNCGMKIFNTSYNETGLWKMQIGHYDVHTMDETVYIPVRVGERAMVAVNKTVSVQQNSQLTLKCRAVANDPNILEYCRFTLPDGTGFQINQKVTEDNPIDDLYWYNGKSVESGDCQVTIKEVSSKHYGKWYCSGKIQGSKILEDYDTVDVESGQLSVASISGIAVGAASVLIISVGGFIYYRKKKRQNPEHRSTHLSSSSGSSQSDVAVFERDLPLVSAEARQPQEAVEEIEMSNISHSRTSEQSRPSTSALSRPHSTISESARSVTSAQSARSITSAQSAHSISSARSRPSTSTQPRPSSSASYSHQEETETQTQL